MRNLTNHKAIHGLSATQSTAVIKSAMKQLTNGKPSDNDGRDIQIWKQYPGTSKLSGIQGKFLRNLKTLLLTISMKSNAIHTNVSTIEVSSAKIIGRIILNRLITSLTDSVLSESQSAFRSD